MDCPNCNRTYSMNDRTTKIVEYVCPKCHNTEIIQRKARKPYK